MNVSIGCPFSVQNTGTESGHCSCLTDVSLLSFSAVMGDMGSVLDTLVFATGALMTISRLLKLRSSTSSPKAPGVHGQHQQRQVS